MPLIREVIRVGSLLRYEDKAVRTLVLACSRVDDYESL